MKDRSLAKNALLNSLKTIMGMIFPLITFPYIARTLLVDNVGKINFSTSVVSYFILIAGLGIRSYAIREGAQVRDQNEKIALFTSEIFTINILSSVLAYFLLVVVVAFVPKLQDYSIIIAILSMNIMGTTLGVEWLYTILEDYTYITIRYAVVQIVSIILMFVFVRDQNDYLIYAFITVFSSTTANVLGFVYAKKYVKIRLTTKPNFKLHMKPIMILFAMTIATTIYVNSDSTMLGLMKGDYYVGLYHAATKIYSMVKSVIVACILVALPRLSAFKASGREELFVNASEKVFNSFITLLMPAVVGLFMVSKEAIKLIAGEAYLEAVPSLQILCISLIFAVFATYLTNVFLLPMKKEKEIMYSSICSAVVNVALNFFAINHYAHIGAAVTTLISEFIVMIWQLAVLKFKFPFKIKKNVVLCTGAGCLLIILCCAVIDSLKYNLVLSLILKIVGSMLMYSVVLLALKNEMCVDVISNIKNKISRRK